MTDIGTRLDNAIQVVSRRVACNLLNEDALQDAWDSYAEVGQYDWELIEKAAIARIRELNPSDEVYEAAYDYLTSRGGEDPNDLDDVDAEGVSAELEAASR